LIASSIRLGRSLALPFFVWAFGVWRSAFDRSVDGDMNSSGCDRPNGDLRPGAKLSA
jgi:hypothetical protein